MATYAIIEESGGQRKVTTGEDILIDLYKHGEAQPGDAITFDKVLVLGADDAAAAKLGMPYVSGAKVTAEVLEPVVMGDKVHIFRFRPKKKYKRKIGHRQRFTRVKITAIAG